MKNLFKQGTLKQIRGQIVPNNPTQYSIPIKKAPVQQMKIKPHDYAPFAYNETYQFPDDYEPWKLNYKGNGLFIGCLLLTFFASESYERGYLNKTGLNERRADKVYYQP